MRTARGKASANTTAQGASLDGKGPPAAKKENFNTPLTGSSLFSNGEQVKSAGGKGEACEEAGETRSGVKTRCAFGAEDPKLSAPRAGAGEGCGPGPRGRH